MIDIVGELNRVERFKHAGVDENCGNDKIEDPPDEIAKRKAHLVSRKQTSNTQRPTSNAQLFTHFELSVRRLRHRFFFRQASQPPSSTNTSGSCASLRRRSATSRARSQLCALQ